MQPQPINAKAETVASSPMFRSAFAQRRAIVVADAFYEWRQGEGGTKQPYAIARLDERPLALAGIWQGWRAPDGETVRSFAIVTTTPNQLMADLHNRMPVVLEQQDWPVWLGEAEGEPAVLMRPAAEDVLRLWPVSVRVNSVRNNGPELLGHTA